MSKDTRDATETPPMAMSRRQVLAAGAGVVGAALLASCGATGRALGGGGSETANETHDPRSPMTSPSYDVLIVGGGPAGLAAALCLGRARKRVLLCDAGPPRNERATHIHNFLTRDGTPPAELRGVGRAQLATYPSVEVRDARVETITTAPDAPGIAFDAVTSAGPVRADRVLLATGMIDEMLDIPGFAEAWGHSVHQCPYCHGWEVRDRRWGYLALDAMGLQHGFPYMLRGWTDEVRVFTHAGLEIPSEMAAPLKAAGIAVETRRVVALTHVGGKLTHVAVEGGEQVACDALYAHPPQRHVGLVKGMGLALDEMGYVVVDPMTRATSMKGVYASGDLTTRAQGAIFAAATGTQAGAMINHDLSVTRHAT